MTQSDKMPKECGTSFLCKGYKRMKVIITLIKGQACSEDECGFCDKPMKPNETMWVITDAPICFLSICDKCKEKLKVMPE